MLELAGSSDVLLSCLTNDEAVRSVYTGVEGLLAGARSGTVVLEMSTISPESSRELHRLGARVGVEVLDVAISGSTPAAEEGMLTLLIGGNREVFRAAKPIFQAIAKRYFLLGDSGSGTAMKLVVNTLLGVGMQAIAEAVVLGEKAGLDRERLLEVLSQTAVIAPAHVGKLARAASNEYSPQFPLRLMNKDFQLILKAAAQEHIPMPATEAAFRVNSDELSGNAANGGDCGYRRSSLGPVNEFANGSGKARRSSKAGRHPAVLSSAMKEHEDGSGHSHHRRSSLAESSLAESSLDHHLPIINPCPDDYDSLRRRE
jgi:3-hydroxyisobutyrate dehydrogenase-like beta-hydroxyacid dehydrogenase